MSHYTKEDIIRIVEEEDVEFIRLQFVDIFGILKNMAVTAKQLDSILNNRCTFDAAAINGFDTMHVDELVLVPDLDTFTIFPWRPQRGRVARFICDVRHTDGTPFMGDSRYILKQVIEEAAKDGYTLNVGPESEFFLFDMSEDGQPTTNTSEKGGFFDIGPVDAGENARRDIVLSLSEMGFEMESSYHSNEVCQHHIDFKFDDGIQTADNIMTFKLTVRTVAKRHGLHATFMPKPKDGIHGSGMHLNMSLSRDGKNVFADEKDPNGLSQEAYYFIGGLMRHTRTNMLEVLNSDYIRTARAKGLSEKKVVYKHAFRNTMIPLVTMLAGTLPGLFGGAMITEQVFNIPGIGNKAYRAMIDGDIPFTMSYNMFISIMTVVGVLLSDLAYGLVDPRVKIGK